MKLLAECQICGQEFKAIFNESRTYRCNDCMQRLNALKDESFVQPVVVVSDT